jgi:hypothetical protein
LASSLKACAAGSRSGHAHLQEESAKEERC